MSRSNQVRERGIRQDAFCTESACYTDVPGITPAMIHDDAKQAELGIKIYRDWQHAIAFPNAAARYRVVARTTMGILGISCAEGYAHPTSSR